MDVLEAVLFILSLPNSVLFAIVILFLVWRLDRKKEKQDRVLLLSNALRDLFHPAQSKWPPSYLKAIQHFAGSRRLSHHCSLSLSMLLQDIKRNNIQLRDPDRHIKELILYGHISLGNNITVGFNIDNRLVSSLVVWKVNGYLWASKKTDMILYSLDEGNQFIRVISGLPSYLQDRVSVKSQNTYDLDPIFLPLLRGLSQDCRCSSFLIISLLSVAQSALSDTVRNLQSELQPVVESSDCAVVFEVAFMNKEPSILEPQTGIMNLLPFILPPLYDRAEFDVSTSIFSGLIEILNLLMTGSAAMSIQSARDITKMYTERLTREIYELTNNLWLRDQQVTKMGKEGWRELILRKQWELALYAVGRLNRWWIVVGKQRIQSESH